MPRPIWKGAIAFGLVTVPVGLYSATRKRAELSFRLLHEKDHAPIDYRRFCSEENVEVAWDDIVKGYEYEKGHFVVMTDEDFEKAKAPATHTIDIRDFVPGEDIDFAHFESPYWLAPTPQGRKAYALLRRALEKTGRVGIGTVVLRQRERLAALRPAGHALMLTTLRFADELRDRRGLDLPANAQVRERELQLALQLVESLASEWKPEQYRDTYRDVLRKAIEQKLEGKEISVEAPARPAKVVDLMEKSIRRRRHKAA
jgi:DNA end-binding protein Ku